MKLRKSSHFSHRTAKKLQEDKEDLLSPAPHAPRQAQDAKVMGAGGHSRITYPGPGLLEGQPGRM